MKGRVFLFGDNIDTDIIAPGGYLHLGLDVLKLHSMEALDQNFSKVVKPGDIIVAGHNFGAGSSREQAPLVLKDLGIELVVAVSFARIFFRNAINVGLNIGTINDMEYSRIRDRDSVEYNQEHGILKIERNGLSVPYTNPSGPVLEIIASGGLVNYVRNLVKRQDSPHPYETKKDKN
ncbi:Homoaconitase small subunit [Thermoplasmatales archaeon]|nr:Homoaconitase small subunit [Thermoplasmatales archaeon]